ncbi:MAG: cation:proton antiporter, partial [Actinomycetota bacterium]|nr:cation:proton antiporter [Actinomycetota bacterium]
MPPSRRTYRSIFAAVLVLGVVGSITLAQAQVQPPSGGGYGYGGPGAGAGGIVKPLSGHALLLVLLQAGLLLLVARALGEGAARLGLPSVMGELMAGLVLGPTLLGSIAPGAFEALFPQEAAQVHLLEVISWLGVIMLLILTGFETDVRLIARKGKGAAAISAGGIVVPFFSGLALGFMLPSDFIAKPDQKLVFALFIGTAMSISAIPVIAKVLMEMKIIRRDIGQVTLAAGMIDDTVGWILLSVVAGMASGSGASLSTAGKSLLAVVGVLLFAFLVGRRAVPALIRVVDNRIGGPGVKLTLLMVLALLFGALTHALQLEAVLGAFIVGILVGEVKRFDHQVRHAFEHITLAVFAPIFFATAGLRVDLGALLTLKVFVVALIVLAVAIAGKFIGAYAGARISRLGHWEALSLGAGMNARGAMEIIVATIGLSKGVLTQNMYSIIVVTAIVTSLMAPPLLRWTLGHVGMDEEERKRLEAEEQQRESFLGGLNRVLLPTHFGASSRIAARLIGLLVGGHEIEVTTMYVKRPGRDADKERIKTELDQIESHLDLTKEHVRRVIREAEGDVGDVVVAEAAANFDLLIIGTTGPRSGGEGPLFTHMVDNLIREAPCPMLIVRAGAQENGEEEGGSADAAERLDLRRILLPVAGLDSDREAA